MSSETDDLLNEFDNAAYLGSNLDIEIAKGKLRGHIAILEARAERAEREVVRLNARDIERTQALMNQIDNSRRAELERDSARAATEANDRYWSFVLDRKDAWARRWKRIAKAMYHRTGMYCDLYNASEEKLEALQDKYDWGVLQSEDDDCYWRSKLEKANNRAAVWKCAAKDFYRRLRDVESKYNKLNTCCHCQCLLIIDEFAYCEDCGPPDFDCMNEKCDHCVEHNGRCPEDKDDV